jgi:hypothetical protein
LLSLQYTTLVWTGSAPTNTRPPTKRNTKHPALRGGVALLGGLRVDAVDPVAALVIPVYLHDLGCRLGIALRVS